MFYLAQEGHVINVIPPVDLSGGPTVGDRFSLSNWGHASIVLTIGANAAGSSKAVTLKECTAATGGSSTAIGFSYYVEETSGGDTLGAKQTATATGFNLHASTANITYVIEVDSSELTAGYPWLELNIADATSTTLGSAVAILSGGRYQSEASATAIA